MFLFYVTFCFVSLPVERFASLFGTDYAFHRFDFIFFRNVRVLGNTVRSGRDIPKGRSSAMVLHSKKIIAVWVIATTVLLRSFR